METRQKAAAQDIIISNQASLSRSHMRLCRRNKGREGNNGVGEERNKLYSHVGFNLGTQPHVRHVKI